MKNKTEISNTVEAALFSAEEPLSIKDLRGMFKPDDAPAADELNAILDELASDYHGRGIELVTLQTATVSRRRLNMRALYGA